MTVSSDFSFTNSSVGFAAPPLPYVLCTLLNAVYGIEHEREGQRAQDDSVLIKLINSVTAQQ